MNRPPLSSQAMTAALTGTWYVTRTSLPMWRTWTNPSISYAPLPTGEVVDTVRATRGRHTRLIIGVDTPLETAGAYRWVGVTPLTRWTPSQWRVLLYDAAEGQWLVTLFSATPFTPPGLDICTRQPWLLPDTEQHLQSELAQLAEARPYLQQLFAPHHDWPTTER